MRSDYQLSKSQWREEQMADVPISMVLNLFQSEQLSKYNCKRTDPDDFKGFLRLRRDLFLESGLLYRKAFLRTTEKQVNQFVMPTKFRKRTVTICHEDYGHLGMDRVLVLLQERYFWPKMSETSENTSDNVTDVYDLRKRRNKLNYTQSRPHIL